MRLLLALIGLLVVFGVVLAFQAADRVDDVEPVAEVATTTTTLPPPPPTTTTTEPPPPPTTTTVAPDVPAPPKPRAQPAPRPAPVPSSGGDDVWRRLAACESGQRWDYVGVHHGGLQFLPATWRTARQRYHDRTGVWVPEFAYQASAEQQIAVAKVWLSLTSVRQWPVCGPRVGLTMADAA